MKYTVSELRKHCHTDNRIAYMFDGNEYLSDDYPDVVKTSAVVVNGTFMVDEHADRFTFDLEIACELTMLCALSLKEVIVPLSFRTTLAFADVAADDSILLIDGVTIDLDPYIWAEILVEKPMKVESKDARKHYREEIVTLDESEKLADNPFAKLIKKD